MCNLIVWIEKFDQIIRKRCFMRAVKWPILILVNSFVTLAWDASRSVFRVSVIIVGGVTAIPCDVITICIAMTCLGHRSRQKFFDNVSTLIVLLAMLNRVKRLLCWPELFNAKWIWTTKFFNYSQVNWQNCKTLTPLTAIWLTSFKPTFFTFKTIFCWDDNDDWANNKAIILHSKKAPNSFHFKSFVIGIRTFDCTLFIGKAEPNNF